MRQFKYTNQFKDDLATMCDDYCESLTDQEFEWLIDGLHDKLKEYFKKQIDLL